MYDELRGAGAGGSHRGDRRDRARLPLRPLAPRPPSARPSAGRSVWPASVDLPMIVHTREADEETAAILEEEGASRGGGRDPLLHRRARPRAPGARPGLLHLLLGHRGVSPRRGHPAGGPRGARTDRLLVETDAPFLAPPPHRGKRNEPAFVVEVARRVAALRGVEPAAIGELARRNYARLFRRARSAAADLLMGARAAWFDNTSRIRHLSLRVFPGRASSPHRRAAPNGQQLVRHREHAWTCRRSGTRSPRRGRRSRPATTSRAAASKVELRSTRRSCSPPPTTTR